MNTREQFKMLKNLSEVLDLLGAVIVMDGFPESAKNDAISAMITTAEKLRKAINTFSLTDDENSITYDDIPF